MELPVVLILNYIFDLFVIFNPTLVYLFLTLYIYPYIYCNNLLVTRYRETWDGLELKCNL